MNISLRQLAYFAKTYECLNISVAAKEMYLTQQALSKAILTLEREMGLPLFNRTTEGLVATQYADLLYKHAVPMLESAQNLEHAMAHAGHTAHERLAVGFTWNMVGGERARFPLSLLLEYQRNNPQVELVFNECSSDECAQGVLRSRFDIACVVGPSEDDHLDVLAEVRDDLCAIVSMNSRLASLDSLSCDDVRDEIIRVPPNSRNSRTAIERALARGGVSPRIDDSNISHSLRFECVYHGDGICISPIGSIGDIDLERAKVLPLKTPWPCEMSLQLITRRGCPLTPGMEAFAATFSRIGSAKYEDWSKLLNRRENLGN